MEFQFVPYQSEKKYNYDPNLVILITFYRFYVNYNILMNACV